MTTTTIAETNHAGPQPGRCQVCVVGAGPAGVMLAAVLARYGINVQLHDDRPTRTTVGRADGLQPKAIETFQMLRLGQDLLDTGVKVFDMCMWRAEHAPAAQQPTLRRVGREVHYPADAVDVLHPFILLCHQGMVEGMFVDDLRDSGLTVHRGSKFDTLTYDSGRVAAVFENPDGASAAIQADYLVGCDGARSRVRRCLPDAADDDDNDDNDNPPSSQGGPSHEASYWAVLDGELDTDFPDLWSKTVVYSAQHGSVLIIPRERNLTRFYIQVKDHAHAQQQAGASNINEAFVMTQARKVLAPYSLAWRSVEWFGHYRVVQRVAARFTDADDDDDDDDDDDGPSPPRVFIAGDAAHTHSPKAAQGMNTSMHDAWNLGWKLNLAARGLAKRAVLLGTYASERKKIARDLIGFDYEHANSIAGGDAAALAANVRTNIGFIAGVGVEYQENVLNVAGAQVVLRGAARPGRNLPPGKATRYMDDNPVDVQLDVPSLGQFRVLILAPDVVGAAAFLHSFSDAVLAPSSLLSRLSVSAARSYNEAPRPSKVKDVYYRPERYTTVSHLFTFGLITSTRKDAFEIASLPPVLSRSKWTVYLDNVPHLDTRGQRCADKWLGGVDPGSVALVTVRPDGYVGTIMRFRTREDGAGHRAARSLDEYFGAFLEATNV